MTDAARTGVPTRPPSPAAYAAGSIATGVFSTVPSVLLLYFCTETLGLPPLWAGAVVFAPKVWSLVWDPLVGAWSDNHAGRAGRRRPFLLGGAAAIAAGFVLLFTPPTLPPAPLTAWMGLAYLFLVTGYSIFAVPYIALPAEIAATAGERRRLVSWRIAAGMAGVMIGASGAAFLVAGFGGGRPGYAAMSLTIAAICAVAMHLPYRMMKGRERPPAAPGAGRRISLLASLLRAGRNHAFRDLCLAYFLQLTAVGLMMSALPYVITQGLGRGEQDIGTAMGAMLGLSMIAIPAWSALAGRIGETSGLRIAVLLFVGTAAAFGALLAGTPSWPLALAAIALIGAPFAGVQALPFTLLAHIAHASQGDGAGSSEATLTGVWTAAEKLGLALGPLLTAACLSLWGAHGLPMAISVIMGALLLLSLFWIASRRRD